ncbi:MAG: flippase [Calditrichaeota bacterium]|nr:MAG: flippase [Calditrichota bacterium]
MSTFKRLLKNTSVLILAKGVQPLISLFLIISISRKLGVDGLGIYVTILSYVEIFQIIAAFGLRNLLTREIAQDKSRARVLISASMLISVVSAILAASLMALAVNLISDEAQVVQGTMIVTLALIPAALCEAFEGIIGGFEKLTRVGFAWMGENFLRVGLSLVLIYTGYGIIEIIWVYIGVRYLKAIYYYFYIVKNLSRPARGFSRESILGLLKKARVFALIMVCVTIYWKADVIMLQAMQNSDAVGYYSAAYRFFMLSRILVGGFITSLFPVISNYYRLSPDMFQSACKKSIRVLVVVTLPVAIAFSFFATPILLMTFGEALRPSAAVLRILIWVIIPYAISQVFAFALVASNNQKYDFKVNALSMFSNILLNFILIPRYSYLGATVATLISIHIYVGFQLPFILKGILNVRIREFLSAFSKIGLSGFAMILVIVLGFHKLYFMILLPAAFAFYVVSLFLTGAIPNHDWQEFMNLLRKPAHNKAV